MGLDQTPKVYVICSLSVANHGFQSLVHDTPYITDECPHLKFAAQS